MTSQISRYLNYHRPVWAFCAALLMAVTVLVEATSSVQAQDAAQVRVRSGAHDVFTRLVFDWPERIPYKVSKDGGLVTITFEAAGEIDVKSFNRTPPLFIGGIKAVRSSTTTLVVVAVPPNSKIKNFYAGTSIALDVQEPDEWQEPVALPKTVSLPGGIGASEITTAENTPTNLAVNTDLTATARAEERTLSVAAQSLNDLLSTDPAATSAPAPAAKPAATPTPAPTTARKPLSLTPPGKQNQAPAASTSTAGTAAPVTSVGAALTQGSQTGTVGTPSTAPQTQLSVAKGDDGSLTLRFGWDEPVAAATFRRSGFLWLVFDKRSNVNVPALREAGEGVIKSLQQIYIPQATVLRMTTTKEINPSVRRQGLAWLIDFRDQQMIPRVPIELQMQPDSPTGARVFLPLPEPGKVVTLTDPLIGDNFFVIPGVPLGHGIAGHYKYPQFEVQPSAQGVVIAPRNDDVRVRALRQGIEIASAAPTHPLKFSAVSKEVAASARASALRPLVRLLDLEKWDTPNAASILQTRWVLENAIVRSNDAGVQDARMDLARFYFANAYASEALGVLAWALENDPGLELDREFKLLRGASQALLARSEDAEKDLYAEILNGNDEAEFWRAIVQAERGDLNSASIELRRSGAIARPYPKALRFRLSTVVANAMVEIGDTRNAETQVETLIGDGPDVYEEAKILYVQGRLAELEGDFDGAVTIWEDVMLSPDRLSRYRAAQSRAELLMRLGRITRAEGIEELEKLRFAWRGDDREFNLLRRMGDLYLEEQDYRPALQTLKEAATFFRDHRDAKAVTKLMSDTFNALYLENKADALPPVAAIAIYEEFKELTPAGAAGDTMIQNLADRLVGLDLLIEAAGLLENQIKFRLRGADRARVGARLALIHMLDRKFADAERVLRATDSTGLTPELTQQRSHLLVQALMGQKRYDDGLAVIAQDESLDGELLRSEIYWSTGNWVDATQSLQTVVNLSGARRGTVLNRRQARYLLNLATAMTLAGNERGLTRIRNNFAPAMAQTEFAQAFTLIADRPALGLISPGSVAKRVQVAQNFKTFLTAYRERLEEDPLSAIN